MTTRIITDTLAAWQLDLGPLALILVCALLYGIGISRCRRWPRIRTVYFAGGLCVLIIALESGVDVFSDRLLSVHMVQHLLIMLVGAPLLCAGQPVTLTLRACSPEYRRVLMRLLRGRTVAFISHPLVALAIMGISMFVTHFTALYGISLRNDTIHASEHMLYLGSSLVFWSVLIAPGPQTQRLDSLHQTVYLLVAMPLMTAVGVILETDSTPRYSEYLKPAQALGISAMADQRLAGALMWIGGSIVMGAIALRLVWRAMAIEERRAVVRDHAFPLKPSAKQNQPV